MSKHTVKGFITYEPSTWNGGKPKIDFYNFKPSPEYFPNVAVVSETTIEVEVPDDFNPVQNLVAALEEKKRLLRVKLAEELAVIDERISKLTCIEFTPAEAA